MRIFSLAVALVLCLHSLGQVHAEELQSTVDHPCLDVVPRSLQVLERENCGPVFDYHGAHPKGMICFDLGHSQLDHLDCEIASRVAWFLGQFPERTIRLSAMVDYNEGGGPEGQASLARARVAAFREALIALGVDPGRIGLWGNDLVAPDDPLASSGGGSRARARYRSVLFVYMNH